MYPVVDTMTDHKSSTLRSTLPAGPVRALAPSCARPSASLRDVVSTKSTAWALWHQSLSPPYVPLGPGVLPCVPGPTCCCRRACRPGACAGHAVCGRGELRVCELWER